SASRLPAMANPAGQRTAALSSAIGGLATVRVGRRTAKRFGSQAASAGFGRSRSRADAGVDDERAAQDGFAFAPSSPRTMGNTVEDRDDDERAYPRRGA